MLASNLIDLILNLNQAMFTLNGGAINWKSSKQDTTVDSTTESEYIAASKAAKEVFWIRKFIIELRV